MFLLLMYLGSDFFLLHLVEIFGTGTDIRKRHLLFFSVNSSPVFLLFVSGQKCTFMAGSADERNS